LSRIKKSPKTAITIKSGILCLLSIIRFFRQTYKKAGSVFCESGKRQQEGSWSFLVCIIILAVYRLQKMIASLIFFISAKGK